MRGLLGAALVMLVSSCGVAEEEAVRLKEGQTLAEPGQPLEYCSTLGCPYQGQLCVEVFFEWGRSPPLCLFPQACERLQCPEGRECAFFDGFPGQVKCIEQQ